MIDKINKSGQHRHIPSSSPWLEFGYRSIMDNDSDDGTVILRKPKRVSAASDNNGNYSGHRNASINEKRIDSISGNVNMTVKRNGSINGNVKRLSWSISDLSQLPSSVVKTPSLATRCQRVRNASISSCSLSSGI